MFKAFSRMGVTSIKIPKDNFNIKKRYLIGPNLKQKEQKETEPQKSSKPLHIFFRKELYTNVRLVTKPHSEWN